MKKTKPGIGTDYQTYMNDIHHKMKIKKIENEKNQIRLLQNSSSKEIQNISKERIDKNTSTSPRLNYFLKGSDGLSYDFLNKQRVQMQRNK